MESCTEEKAKKIKSEYEKKLNSMNKEMQKTAVGTEGTCTPSEETNHSMRNTWKKLQQEVTEIEKTKVGCVCVLGPFTLTVVTVSNHCHGGFVVLRWF